MRKRLILYLLQDLHWRLVKAVMIEALKRLPPISRDMVIREIVASEGGKHVHRNPRKARAENDR
jgi:hypothetical protein